MGGRTTGAAYAIHAFIQGQLRGTGGGGIGRSPGSLYCKQHVRGCCGVCGPAPASAPQLWGWYAGYVSLLVPANSFKRSSGGGRRALLLLPAASLLLLGLPVLHSRLRGGRDKGGRKRINRRRQQQLRQHACVRTSADTLQPGPRLRWRPPPAWSSAAPSCKPRQHTTGVTQAGAPTQLKAH